ncbi:hypothetical protein FVEN_g198 [Fusarium venenatum]|nr:hypothetical protein FVEN_g198 [Fusarium venenatum]
MSNRIYYNVICYFIRKNKIDSRSRLRSKRPRDEDTAFVARPPQRRRLRTPESESPTSSPITPLYDSSPDERESPLPSSQDSHSTVPSAQGEARQEVYQTLPRANESPDELAQDYDEEQPTVPNLQQRHVNRLGDEHGNISRISLGQQPVPHAPRTNLHARYISRGTQTTPSVNQQRQWRAIDAPLPSSFNTDIISQQRHDPASDRANGAEEPASQSSVEDIPRPFDIPLGRPRIAIPKPDFKIDLVVSYDVIPGHNALFEPNGDIFSYSLAKFLSQVNWQHEPEVLLICLQAPGTSPATPVRTWKDRVFKNDEDKFQSVLRRFRQIFLDEHFNFTRVKMDAVIEIAFENMVEGHTHCALIDACCNRGRAVGKV